MAWQHDWVLRVIEQIGAILRAVLKLRQTGDHAGARRELERALTLLFGPRVEVIAALGAEDAAEFLDNPDAVAVYARLLHELADVRREQGEEDAAASIDERADALAEEAKKRGATIDLELD